LLNRYVLRAFRALRCRSVPFWRSTNEVLIAQLTADIPRAASTAAIVPKTTRVAIATTRPFARVFSTTA
jgi:hypothetical protein